MQDTTTYTDTVNSDSHLVTTPAGITFNPQTDEEWRDMVGAPWEGKFEISNMGRRRYRADYDGQRYPLNEWGAAMPSGHRKFTARLDGKQSYYLAHRAVWEAFVGPIDDDSVVRHWADNPHDNRLSELSIGTPRDNSHDRMRNSGNLSPNHCEVGHAKLSGNLVVAHLNRGRSSCRSCHSSHTWASDQRKKGIEPTEQETRAKANEYYARYGGDALDDMMNAHLELTGEYPPAFTLEELLRSVETDTHPVLL